MYDTAGRLLHTHAVAWFDHDKEDVRRCCAHQARFPLSSSMFNYPCWHSTGLTYAVLFVHRLGTMDRIPSFNSSPRTACKIKLLNGACALPHPSTSITLHTFEPWTTQSLLGTFPKHFVTPVVHVPDLTKLLPVPLPHARGGGNVHDIMFL